MADYTARHPDGPDLPIATHSQNGPYTQDSRPVEAQSLSIGATPHKQPRTAESHGAPAIKSIPEE